MRRKDAQYKKDHAEMRERRRAAWLAVPELLRERAVFELVLNAFTGYTRKTLYVVIYDYDVDDDIVSNYEAMLGKDKNKFCFPFDRRDWGRLVAFLHKAKSRGYDVNMAEMKSSWTGKCLSTPDPKISATSARL